MSTTSPSFESLLNVASTGAKMTAAVVGMALAKAAADRVADRIVPSTLDKSIQTFKLAVSQGQKQSYIRAAAAVRVEPYVMIDEEVVGLPFAKDLLNLGQRFFTCYYLLAQSAENTIAGVSIAQRLSKFSPDRDLISASKDMLSSVPGSKYSTENYKFGLPGNYSPYAGYKGLMSEESLLSLENKQLDALIKRNDGGSQGMRVENIEKVVNDVGNLAIGQLVNVTLVDGKETAVQPVQIRLRPMAVPSVAVIATFALNGKSYSLPARLQQKRVGEIGWKDLILQTDRVREYREIAKQDRSGFFRQTHQRNRKGWLATMLSGKRSVGEMSSIIVTTTNTVKQYERSTGQNLNDFQTRQRILEDTLSMIILVVDPDFMTVQVYLDTVDDSNARYNLADIKMGGKNDGNDLTALMTSLLEGRIPGRL